MHEDANAPEVLHHLDKYKHLAFDNSYITMFMLNCWLLYLWLTWCINWIFLDAFNETKDFTIDDGMVWKACLL